MATPVVVERRPDTRIRKERSVGGLLVLGAILGALAAWSAWAFLAPWWSWALAVVAVIVLAGVFPIEEENARLRRG